MSKTYKPSNTRRYGDIKKKIIHLIDGPHKGIYTISPPLKTWIALKHPDQDAYITYRYTSTRKINARQKKANIDAYRTLHRLDSETIEISEVHLFYADSKLSGIETAVYSCMLSMFARQETFGLEKVGSV